jgi:hypothetical protein
VPLLVTNVGIGVPGNFLPRHDITDSRELKTRELRGSENDMTSIREQFNGNFDGD